MNVRALLSVLAIGCFALSAVENSIIPLMERMELPENLSRKKYTSNQALEILSALSRREERIRVVTYNVLFNLNDSKLEEENRWPQRLPRVVEVIEEIKPD